MPSTTEKQVKNTDLDFSARLNQIRALQEELLYASFYREREEFSRLLYRLKNVYWELYDLDEKPE